MIATAIQGFAYVSKVSQMSECRNCGRGVLHELGPIGRVEPFFLKRVFGMELRPARSPSPVKQLIRNLVSIPLSFASRVHTLYSFVELQVCAHCSFIQTKIPFHEEDIMRLYADYRDPSYHRERIQYEPSYATIAAAVGYDEVEISTRTTALDEFLRRALPATDSFTMLDYGGSDGRFMPNLPGVKFVYDVSKVDPLPGIVRINSESELGTYSLVLLAHVTEHLVHPLNLVRKLHSYVEPGGYLYIETPQEVSDEQRKGLVQGTLKRQLGIHEHINYYCIPAVSALLESAGFKVAAIDCAPVDLGWAKSAHVRALGRKAIS
jgi:hypothetical protein